ncbi:hypothetical protein [Rhodopirellula sp. P2]|uniref:hypothetical protein n=1 Tax=Rhodopirellula sp. P2 TaxID=2127060 RepID=UPI002367646D|nr:hypothetical protein [Rhodopirellula sp. P2]WDQ14998.1 hypothetical protein PSR62_15275 [Rhodopirellula sp. P2]
MRSEHAVGCNRHTTWRQQSGVMPLAVRSKRKHGKQDRTSSFAERQPTKVLEKAPTTLRKLPPQHAPHKIMP